MDFRELISAVVRLPYSVSYAIQLPWVLINVLQTQLFARMYEKLGEDQAEYRDLLYLAFEKVLNKIYESFRTFQSSAPLEI